jgi:hypothetical protein
VEILEDDMWGLRLVAHGSLDEVGLEPEEIDAQIIVLADEMVEVENADTEEVEVEAETRVILLVRLNDEQVQTEVGIEDVEFFELLVIDVMRRIIDEVVADEGYVTPVVVEVSEGMVASEL